MWANRSFCSPKMSDHEWFAQVAHRKWAMWANRSFRSPKMIEWLNHYFFEQIAHSIIFGQKTSDSLGNQLSQFPALEFAFSLKIAQIKERLWANCSLRCLIRTTVSKSLLSFFTKERTWANQFCRSVKKVTWGIRSWFEQIALKNKWLTLSLFHSQKTSDSFKTLMSEFPTQPGAN